MIRSLRRLALLGVLALSGALWATESSAQVTTGSMRGVVSDSAGTPLPGVRVVATHVPSGTVYQGTTRADGRFVIAGMRVGGPYTVEAQRIGFTRQSRDGLEVSLGVSTDVVFRMGQIATTLQAVTVTSTGGDIAETRTGAATTIPQTALEQLPTIGRRIDDFTRLTPQSGVNAFGSQTFGGVDARLNNIMVDGAYFNNSFGLRDQPGATTGVSPISLDAIKAVQVSIAPYDVRQGNFTGAAVNTVTKSGDNELSGSLYYFMQNNDLVGTKVGPNLFNPGKFEYSNIGAFLSGPIIKDKLHFMASIESDGRIEPGTTFRANQGGEPIGGSITRVLATDLDALSTYLSTNFGYATGGYEGYDHEIPAFRFTGRLDYSFGDRNKFSLRYTQLDSETDQLLSNSSSLGFGTRRTNLNGLNFQNSNYKILENIRSIVGEWNTQIADNLSNSMIVGYTSNDESRKSLGSVFPMVDILQSNSVYTTFGFEPFTPNNELRYNSIQFQDNFTRYGARHDQTIGVSIERYESENVFFSGSQSVYVYNSLADFYTDANDYIANPGRTTSPITLNRFQVRWMNVPGLTKPVQPLEVLFAGIYAQDEWRALDNLTMTFGLRLETPKFGDTGFENAEVDGMDFRDELGNTVRYSTSKLPDPKILFSPRFGFNWDVMGDGVTQVRGGTGVFTGRPAYVWISNQIGENGILTGFENITGITTRPFNPDPSAYKPTTVDGTPASAYGLAFTDPDFKFPQVWRSNLAMDRKLPWGMVGTFEWLVALDVNGVYYIDANLSPADGNFNGPDQRARWSVDDCPAVSGTQQRLNCKISNAIVMKNQNRGNSFNVAASLEKSFDNGLYAKAAWSYGESRNTVDPGSIASGSWQSNAHSYDPNNPGVGYSNATLGHRFFVASTYRRNFLPIGPTGVSIFLESRMSGNGSYIFGSDMNGDGATNDLLYIPKNASEMRFQQFNITCPTSGCTAADTFTVAEQVAAFEALIQQDRYLRSHRGKYVERGAVFLPMVTRADVSFTQEVTQTVGGKPHRVEFRLDVLNFTNMFNSDWGRSYSFVSTSPLVSPSANGSGEAQYRMRNFGRNLISRTIQRNNGVGDVWRIQMGVRYTFN